MIGATFLPQGYRALTHVTVPCQPGVIGASGHSRDEPPSSGPLGGGRRRGLPRDGIGRASRGLLAHFVFALVGSPGPPSRGGETLGLVTVSPPRGYGGADARYGPLMHVTVSCPGAMGRVAPT